MNPGHTGQGNLPREIKMRSGITGIERDIKNESQLAQKNISAAFQDINSLIDKAKPMVQLVQAISNKLKDKQGSITDDDTVEFRQHLLSLGIKDPVTKSKFGTGHVYFEKLAKEISQLLEETIKRSGGMMSLVEAFIRVNRARGIELVSPEDLLSACQTLRKLKLRLELREIGKGVLVLQHESFDDEMCIATVVSMLDHHGSLTPEEYARNSGIPPVVAKHCLILAETRGKLCRDDSIEGLRFYHNLFLFPQK